MDLELTEEQRMLADSARAFVSEELLPHENEVEKQGEVPRDLGNRSLAKQSKWASMLPTCPRRLEAVVLTTPAWQ